MGYEPFYISNYEQDSGLENYFESFLLPEKAFPKLEDAYCWRGKIKRRGGNFLLGRLRRLLAAYVLPVTGAGNYANADILVAQRTAAAPAVAETYAEIQSGSVTITLDRGNPGQTQYKDTAPGVLTMVVGGTYTISAGTINYVTGAVTLNFLVLPGAGITVDTDLAYYPALPCTGLRTYEQVDIHLQKMIAFDQKYAYEFNPAAGVDAFVELTGSAPTTWNRPVGRGPGLMWTTNYYHKPGTLLWATNFNDNGTAASSDPIRYYDGAAWHDFTPTIDAAANVMRTCLCLLPFKDSLLAFNTWEGPVAGADVNFPNRVRWSQVGDPTVAATSWRVFPGLGGVLDAPTDEHIVSVEYVKDVVLVKFERSSWRLVYTGDQVQPFIFQKINTTFGANATFSLVPFDDGVYSISNNGIVTDDSTAVERIDIKIPNQAFSIEQSPKSAYGIRDFTNELVYWAFTDQDLYAVPSSTIYNNKTLVFNYRNNSWAKFNESYTSYGIFQIAAPTARFPATFKPYNLEIAAGNQQGFVEILNKQVINSASLAITSITGVGAGGSAIIGCPNYNFSAAGDYWVRLDGIMGLPLGGATNPANLNYSVSNTIYHVRSDTANNFEIDKWDQATLSFIPVSLPFGGTYLGGGQVTILQNFNITTKNFSPFYEQAQQVRIPYVDFFADRTTSGEFTTKLYVNEATPAINDPDLPVTSFGRIGSSRVLTSPENIALIPLQTRQQKIWHRFFSNIMAQSFTLELKMSNVQMSSQAINNNDFVLHAMTLYMSQNARMVQ